MIGHLLYTWIDVEFVLEQARAKGQFPDWLHGFTVYVSGLLLYVGSNTEKPTIEKFLESVFGTRYDAERGLILVSVPGSMRIFPIDIEYLDGNAAFNHRGAVLPTFRRLAPLIDGWSAVEMPVTLAADDPGITAFYSFKGGVGRTTHLLAYLRALSSRPVPVKALVVDADLEAPGITSLLRHEPSFSAPEFSIADLIALAQSDTTNDFSETLLLATNALKKQVLVLESDKGYVEHFMLPAFRSDEQALRLDVRPEHLISRPGKTWSLTELLTGLGKRLGVGLILMDLRAGFSELSSPILFDPRVRRILVTTPSHQSTHGTIQVLRELSKLAPPASRADLKDPIVIISFLVSDLLGSERLSDLSTVLLESYPEPDADVELARLRIEYTTFAQDLLYLDSISDASRKLAGTMLERVVGSIADMDVPRQVPAVTQAVSSSLVGIRSKLSELAKELEYAEAGVGQNFLKIAPLRAIARQFSESLPIAIVIGSKGAGKTYTCLQLVRRKLWSVFVRDAGGNAAEDKGLIWPVLHSSSLNHSALLVVEDCRNATATALTLTTAKTSIEIEDLVRQGLLTLSDETWWRHNWFCIIARSLGIDFSTPQTAAAAIIEKLRHSGASTVIVFDGLEDLFPALEGNQAQQVALRALLQSVPRYLQEVPDCPLGIVVFVRADLAQGAIPQNYGQFARLYEPFSLKWNEEEALRLAVWLATMAGVQLEPSSTAIPPEVMTAQDAKDALVPLWGRKLGLEESREARTAEWVIAALSDFRGQIQARDLVRFLRHAAADKRNAAVSDRVLAPRAIRDAIVPCSEEKIAEIKQEIPALSGMFTRLQNSTDRRIPFDSASSGLTAEEIRFLQNVGVILEDRGEFLMPEIFRLGLGFQLAKGKRPRVLSVARRVISSFSSLRET